MMHQSLHKYKIRILTGLGFAIDIKSSGKWPGNALSNFCRHEFDFEGMRCGSMEGFLQAIKKVLLSDKNRKGHKA